MRPTDASPFGGGSATFINTGLAAGVAVATAVAVAVAADAGPRPSFCRFSFAPPWHCPTSTAWPVTVAMELPDVDADGARVTANEADDEAADDDSGALSRSGQVWAAGPANTRVSVSNRP